MASSRINPAQIASNYAQVMERIAAAAQSSGRAPEAVRLVVVTKAHPAEAVQAVIEAGGRFIGENYADEALPKIEALRGEPDIEWHMIGHIQSRKARLICSSFDYVHSLDSLKLAEQLNRYGSEDGKRLPVLFECNISGETTKFGWPAYQESTWPELLPAVERILALPFISVRGLMTMAPYAEDPELARPYFKRLRRLQEYLAAHIPQGHWAELSMGMSGDYEIAIQEGATWVRIGTAILGPRI